MSEGIIYDIKRFAIHDGPGIRTTIFLKGCPLSCWWCHNPEGQKKEPEKIIKIWKGSRKNEIIGEKVSIDYVLKEIKKEEIFYDESGGGVTFSGGEPLMQIEFLRELLKECNKIDIHTAIDTSGYASAKKFESILEFTDLFLFDLKIMDQRDHLKYTGASNKSILNNLKTLQKFNKRTFLRFAIIPGITDIKQNIEDIIKFIKPMKNIERVDILPYHRTGIDKYKRLNKRIKKKDIKIPGENLLNNIKKSFLCSGLKVNIGG